MKSEQNDSVGKPDRQDSPGKHYRTPTLTVYGTVEQITLNIGTKGTDGLTGSSIG